ncbi:hypothetical protein EON81_25870 [bacterium]|nr:MAG: hypothetical protein EON81_25870 [bacterium]
MTERPEFRSRDAGRHGSKSDFRQGRGRGQNPGGREKHDGPPDARDVARDGESTASQAGHRVEAVLPQIETGNARHSYGVSSFRMMPMRRALSVFFSLAIPIAVLLPLGGCGQAQSLGGKTRPKRYRNIVSLSPSTTEILVGNGVPIVGRTSSCNYPSTVSRVPVVGGVKPNYEALARIKPDLIVYDADLYGDAEVRKLQATGAKLYRFGPQTLDEYEREIYEMGSLLGTETGFSGYLDRVNAEETTALGDPPTPQPTVAIILPDAGGRHMIAGNKGFRAECLRIAGGKQVGPDSDRFEPLSPEFLVAQDPDVIIVAGDPVTFEKDSRFAGLKARRNAKVYGLPADVVLRRGGRVNLLIKNLSKALSLRANSGSAGTATTSTAPAETAPAGTASAGTN